MGLFVLFFFFSQEILVLPYLKTCKIQALVYVNFQILDFSGLKNSVFSIYNLHPRRDP